MMTSSPRLSHSGGGIRISDMISTTTDVNSTSTRCKSNRLIILQFVDEHSAQFFDDLLVVSYRYRYLYYKPLLCT